MHTPTLVLFFFFFFNDTATTEIYTLSLHDALPIYARGVAVSPRLLGQPHRVELLVQVVARRDGPTLDLRVVPDDPVPLQRGDVVNLLVEQPPLELSDGLLPLLRVAGATLLLVELVERSVHVPAGV